MIICYFGDSITLGYGDPSGLGWPGRISGTLSTLGVDVTSYNLGVRKDASTVLQHRWRKEAELRRMDGMDFKLVFSFGAADILTGQTTEDTLEAAEAIQTEAKTMGDVLVVGPTPVADEAKSKAIGELSAKLAKLCKHERIPFVPSHQIVSKSETYQRALADGDSVHPTAMGYAALAQYILQTEPARDFFGLE